MIILIILEEEKNAKPKSCTNAQAMGVPSLLLLDRAPELLDVCIERQGVEAVVCGQGGQRLPDRGGGFG